MSTLILPAAFMMLLHVLFFALGFVRLFWLPQVDVEEGSLLPSETS